MTTFSGAFLGSRQYHNWQHFWLNLNSGPEQCERARVHGHKSRLRIQFQLRGHRLDHQEVGLRWRQVLEQILDRVFILTAPPGRASSRSIMAEERSNWATTSTTASSARPCSERAGSCWTTQTSWQTPGWTLFFCFFEYLLYKIRAKTKLKSRLNLASATWFYTTPQPPKPSMLHVIDGTWQPNEVDRRNGIVPVGRLLFINILFFSFTKVFTLQGFGTTINIINGGLECNKPNGKESPQAKNRIAYYKKFAWWVRN